MKKMYNYRRRGFTLVEIIVVVAIIVVLSGAAFVGVAVTVDRAKQSGDAAAEHGQNFEDAAWARVKSIAIGAADLSDIYEYSPIIIDDDNETNDEEDTTGNNGENTEDNDVVDDTTGDKTTDGDTTTDDKTTVIEDNNTVVTTTSTNPHIANTYKSTNNSNAQGSNVSNGNPNISHDYTEQWFWTAERGSWSERTYTNTKIEASGQITASNNKIEEVILTVPSGTTGVYVDSWRYSVEKVDNTHYRIFYDAPSKNNDGENNYIWNPPETSISYRYSEYYSDPNVNKSSGVIVSEYSTSQ